MSYNAEFTLPYPVLIDNGIVCKYQLYEHVDTKKIHIYYVVLELIKLIFSNRISSSI